MSFFNSLILADLLPAVVEEHLNWFVAGAIVLIGLFVLGIKDVFRFSPRRAMAIASVCFSESIRRKVLLITPLAILGVIIVSQLQKPFDEQDAIRQTTKFCLFATGFLVVVSAIILACTNLPREIENRVIYTVVTKPTTRLEIVVGKVLGFAFVSGAILIIMGAFTWGYLHLRAWNMTRDIRARLDAGTVDPLLRPTLAHYADFGLLNAKTKQQPLDVQIYSRLPKPGDQLRWMSGNEQSFVVPFEIRRNAMIVPGDPMQVPGAAGLVIEVSIGYEQRAPTTEEWQQIAQMEAAATAATRPTDMGPPPLPATVPSDPAAMPTPQVTLQILDANLNPLVNSRDINGGRPLPLPPAYMNTPVQVYLAPEIAAQIASQPMIYVQVLGATPGVEYGIGDDPITLFVPGPAPGTFVSQIGPMPDATRDGKPSLPMIRGRGGSYGQQLRGAADNNPVAVYRFRDADLGGGIVGQVPFEMRVGIERSGDELSDADVATEVELVIHNHKAGVDSKPVRITPENNRPAFFDLPAASVMGGEFDVIVRNRTPGHWVGLQQRSLVLVNAKQPFAYNLFKSLLILWFMSLLVVIVSIFASTFLSWPVAVVLTLVILLGHWGVQQLGDATSPGIGHMVAQDLGLRDPAKTKVVSSSIEALSRMLNFLSKVLPDISQFSATEDIERGDTIPHAKLLDSLKVLAAFGLPMLVLAYVFLKYKEVAP